MISLAVSACLSMSLSGCGKKSTEEHLDAARQFVAANDSEAAIIEFKNAVKSNPKAPLPRFELGKLYLQMGDYEGAEKELNRAMDLGHSASEVIPLLSVAYQKTGAENALADVDYRMEGMSAVESAEVGFYKMQALAQLGKNDDAMALIDDLEKLDTSSVYRGLALAYRHIINNENEAAVASLKTLREQAPQNKDVLQQLGKLAMATGDKDTALDAFEDYVDSNPNDLTSKFVYITLLIEQGKTEQAEPMVDEMLALNPVHPLLNQYKGIIEANSGNYEQAIARFKTAIQGGQDNDAIKLVAGYSAYQMQDYILANKYLAEVAPSLPPEHPALRLYADSLLQLGEGEVASQVLNRVDAKNEGDATLFSKAGYQLLQQGNLVDAKAMIEKSSEMSQTAEDLARLGVLQLSINDIEGLVNLEAAAAQAPDSIVTQRTLITAYMSTGKFDEANAAAQEWAEKEPDNHVPHLFLAEIAFKQGEKALAMEEIDKAEALQPENADIEIVRARLLLTDSDFDGAVEVLNNALTVSPGNGAALTLLYTIASQYDAADEGQVAQQILTQLKQQPDNLGLRLLAARVSFTKEDYQQTLNLLEPVEETAETPKVYWNLKGQTLMRMNDLLGAKGHYEQWLSLYPQDKTGVLGMLLLLDAEQKYGDALSLTNAFLSKRPDSQIRLLKAHFLALSRQGKAAKAIMDDMPDSVNTLPLVRSINARIALLEGKKMEALEDANAAYEATPNAQNAILVVAVYESAGQSDKALAFIEKHLEQKPDDLRVAMMYAQRFIDKDNTKAKAVYNDILNKSPDNFVVLNNLAYLYYQDGELDEAAPLAKRAVGLQPRNADSVDTLAQITIQQNKYEEALSMYDAVISDDSRVSDTVYLNYVQLLLDMGRKEVARQKIRGKDFVTEAGKERAERMRVRYSL